MTYADGLLCEHEYMFGPPCDEPATWVTTDGRAVCEPHFEDSVRDSRNPRAREEARRLT